MPRYEVSDPTQTGFAQVTDVSQRTGPFDATDDTGKPIKKYGGITMAVALYTDYLSKASKGRIDPTAEANKLAQKLNAMPQPTANMSRFVVQYGDCSVYDDIGEKILATFRPAFCPNAQREAEDLAKRLNGIG